MAMARYRAEMEARKAREARERSPSPEPSPSPPKRAPVAEPRAPVVAERRHTELEIDLAAHGGISGGLRVVAPPPKHKDPDSPRTRRKKKQNLDAKQKLLQEAEDMRKQLESQERRIARYAEHLFDLNEEREPTEEDEDAALAVSLRGWWKAARRCFRGDVPESASSARVEPAHTLFKRYFSGTCRCSSGGATSRPSGTSTSSRRPCPRRPWRRP